MHKDKLMSTEKDRDPNQESVLCSKCNSTFENESEFMEHYNSQHSSQQN
jgi:uncharacterized C2H2 Zn-finger protein